MLIGLLTDKRGSGSPEGIRTLVAGLRSQSPRPLDDGAALMYLFILHCYYGEAGKAGKAGTTGSAGTALGYQDSNLDSLNQNQKGCQLPHTPI